MYHIIHLFYHPAFDNPHTFKLCHRW